ncbi:hypothetical protein V1514DRAFT_337020 [Lipomyces japonicus]|uniref:uncharacterized protein n=1 Tax=Lipomyces japonicus TaxID=56871 RepID=UPI0034CEF2CE
MASFSNTNGADFRGKNLVLCFDGTGSKFGERPPSNLLKLLQMLEKNTTNQICYYQPGIGSSMTTDNDHDFLLSTWRSLLLRIDSAIAYSFVDHVLSGYHFLLRYYEPGDRIWMFGYSRGAFIARVLSGMIDQVGLLGKGAESLVECAWQLFNNWEQNCQPSNPACRPCMLTAEFRATFGHDTVNIHFLGLWDTVSAVGVINSGLTMPHGASSNALHVRHAVSVDERRAKFRENLYKIGNDRNASDIVECWFPGNHGDIGGGWRAADTANGASLCELSLRWMTQECASLGLRFKPGVIASMADKEFYKTIMAPAHDMLSFSRSHGKGPMAAIKWWLIELIPLPYLYTSSKTGELKVKWRSNIGRRRQIPTDALMHCSVAWKKMLDPRYEPKNVHTPLISSDDQQLSCHAPDNTQLHLDTEPNQQRDSQ